MATVFSKRNYYGYCINAFDKKDPNRCKQRPQFFKKFTLTKIIVVYFILPRDPPANVSWLIQSYPLAWIKTNCYFCLLWLIIFFFYVNHLPMINLILIEFTDTYSICHDSFQTILPWLLLILLLLVFNVVIAIWEDKKLRLERDIVIKNLALLTNNS